MDMDIKEWELLRSKGLRLDPRGGVVDMYYFNNLQPMANKEPEIGETSIYNPEPEPEPEPIVEGNEERVMDNINAAAPVALANMIYQALVKELEDGRVVSDGEEKGKGKEREDEGYVMVPESKESDNVREGLGLRGWTSRLMGVGSLRSIGVAAATVCLLVLSGKASAKLRSPAKEKKQAVEEGPSAVNGAQMGGFGALFGSFYGTSDSINSMLDDICF